jgi:hypothetical protein
MGFSSTVLNCAAIGAVRQIRFAGMTPEKTCAPPY